MQLTGLLQGRGLHGRRNLRQRQWHLQVWPRLCGLHVCHFPRALQWHSTPQQQRPAGNLLL